MRPRRRFTMVELMIVVAIISLLAAIAVPLLTEMQLKAKRAEGPPNIDGLMTAITAYNASFDVWPAGDTQPVASLGKAPRPWPTYASSFQDIGWSPDGDVRGTYSILYNRPGGCMMTMMVLMPSPLTMVQLDVDGDAMPSCYVAWTEPAPGDTEQWLSGPNTY